MAPKGNRDSGQSTEAPKINSKRNAESQPKPSELSPKTTKTSQRSNDASENRPIKFSSNAALDAVSPPDNTVEICGYIDVAEREKTVGKDRKYSLIKFVLNNNCGKRVQCAAWQDQVQRIKEMIQINKVRRLNGAVAKKVENPIYNVGNVPFELTVQEHTEIIDKGFYQEAENPTEHPEVTEWNNVGSMEGRLIKIDGYLKMKFTPTKHKTGEAMYTIGAITDGRLKMAVRVTDSGKLPDDLQKGCAITVIGIVHYDGNNPYIKAAKGSHITKIEGAPMHEDDMMEAAFMPQKKARME